MTELTVNLGFAEYTAKLHRLVFTLPDVGVKYPDYEDILSRCVYIAGSSYHEEELEQYLSELSYHFKDEVSYVYSDMAHSVKQLIAVIRCRYQQMGWLDDEGACIFRFNGVQNQYDLLVWRG